MSIQREFVHTNSKLVTFEYDDVDTWILFMDETPVAIGDCGGAGPKNIRLVGKNKAQRETNLEDIVGALSQLVTEHGEREIVEEDEHTPKIERAVQ